MISLRSEVTKKILNYFFINPHAKHYINELARILNQDPKNVDRKLKYLEKNGLLESDFMGKQRYFYLSQKYPLLKEYRKIILASIGIEQNLKKILAQDKQIKQAYIFGSYAKNNMDASSDIDLLIIGNHSPISLRKKINKIQKETNREINIINLSEQEFETKRKEKNPFIVNIFSEKIIKLL